MTGSTWLVVGLAAALVAAVGARERSDEIVCKSMTLVDENGAVIAKFGQFDDGRAGIRIVAKDARSSIEVSINRETGSPVIQFSGGESDDRRMSLANGGFKFMGPGGTELQLAMDRSGQSNLSMLSGESSIELICMKKNAMIEVSTPGGDRCSTHATSNGAGFSIQTKAGAPVWRAGK